MLTISELVIKDGLQSSIFGQIIPLMTVFFVGCLYNHWSEVWNGTMIWYTITVKSCYWFCSMHKLYKQVQHCPHSSISKCGTVASWFSVVFESQILASQNYSYGMGKNAMAQIRKLLLTKKHSICQWLLLVLIRTCLVALQRLCQGLHKIHS